MCSSGPGTFASKRNRDAFVGFDLDHQHVRLDLVGGLAVEPMRNRLEGYGDLGHLARQPLSGTQVERNAGPAPVLDEELDGGKGLGVRIGRDVGLLAVALYGFAVDRSRTVLPARAERPNGRVRRRRDRRENFVLFVADIVGVGS